LGGVGVDSFEDISEVGEGVEAFEFAAGDEAIDDGGTSGPGFAAGEHVIFSANDDHSQSAFGNIVVDVEYGAIGVTHQSVPLIQGVGDGFAQRVFRQRLIFVFHQSVFDFVEDRSRFVLPHFE